MTKAYGKLELTARYSNALFNTAKEKHNLDKVLEDINSFISMVNSSEDLKSLIKNPSISVESKISALDEISLKAGFTDTFSNFIRVVTENHRLFLIPDMCKKYLEIVDIKNGIETVMVKTARPLKEEQKDLIMKNLSKVLNKKIKLNARIDKSLLGGVQIAVGSIMIDSSYKTKLNQIKLLMVKD